MGALMMKMVLKMKKLAVTMTLLLQLSLLGGKIASCLYPWKVHTPFFFSINHFDHLRPIIVLTPSGAPRVFPSVTVNILCSSKPFSSLNTK